MSRTIQSRIVATGLGRVLDPADVWQQVLAGFCTGAAAGRFELASPRQLVRLLATTARNNLVSQARKEAARLDHGASPGGLDPNGLAAPVPGPDREGAARELLGAVYRLLAPDVRGLVELRNDGHGWAAIAERLQGDPVVLRKRLSRALVRVARELKLDREFAC